MICHQMDQFIQAGLSPCNLLYSSMAIHNGIELPNWGLVVVLAQGGELHHKGPIQRVCQSQEL